MRSIVATTLALGSLALAQQRPLNSPQSSAPAYRDELLRLHKDLVSTPSISGDENAIGTFIVDYLTARDYHATLQPVAPIAGSSKDRFNILAWKGERAPRAKVALSSHMDVVPPHIPYSISPGPVDKDSVIMGRGTNDDKGSLAAQVVALEQLLAEGKAHPDDVMFVLVVGEEVAGDGMVAFSRSLEEMDDPPPIKAVIFGEPTENKLACGHKGGLFCDLKAEGAPGHSGYPWLSKSANELMVRALAKILDTDLGHSELFGDTTFNIGLYRGGVASNVIPEHAFVQFAARLAAGKEKTEKKIVQDKIQAILDEVDKDAFELICTHGYGPVESNCDVDGMF